MPSNPTYDSTSSSAHYHTTGTTTTATSTNAATDTSTADDVLRMVQRMETTFRYRMLLL
jgi:hypothetical protein